MLVMTPFSYLQHRAAHNWLVGLDSQRLVERAALRMQELSHSTQPPPTVLLAESNPVDFLAGLIAACSLHCPVFLGNPQWAEAEWQQVLALAEPDVIWSEGKWRNGEMGKWGEKPRPQPGWIMIPTGGSSGQIRFAIHTWETLTAAVSGFQTYFQVEQIHSCCVLPLYHVSGLMQFLRSFVTGGKLAILPLKTFEQHLHQLHLEEFFLSLVPTQLQRLLQLPNIESLAQFQTIFLGGASAWDTLLETARSHRLRLAPTYGMTETAAQIATLKPNDFLQGATGVGAVLPHATVQICDSTGGVADIGEVGAIVVESSSLMLGYFPDATQPTAFQTDDLGFLDALGNLHIVGRNSQKIITGGENVFPAEVEAAIRSTGLVRDVSVVGMPDQTWGEAVTAIYVPRSPEVNILALQTAITPRLSKYKHPKQWIVVDSLPRNVQGKVNYEMLKQIL
jgi:O-succinylbenzoic acid--CoA ligase